jgi:hypothetical protein
VTLSLSASGTALLTSAIGQQLPIPSPQLAFEAANQIVVGEAGCDACVLNGDAWGEETCALFIALHDMPRVGAPRLDRRPSRSHQRMPRTRLSSAIVRWQDYSEQLETDFCPAKNDRGRA